jgi:methylmalonyl-CoA/ethylmalonyl-CoA epimerase
MTINPSRIAQIAVPIRDLERAKHFYGEVLGLTHLFDAPPGLAFYQCGETRLMLTPPSGPETVAAAIVYYGVEDAAEAERKLVAAGIAIEVPAHVVATVGDREIWLAAARDSESNFIGLMSEKAVA